MALDVLNRRSFGETARRDAWWVQPLVVFLGLSTFIVYSTWAAFQGAHYRFGNYLSPFYSPEVFGDPETSWFGGKPGWWPGLIPWSAAFFILWAPGGFRFTCYYYRGAYYKAFWADPPSCAVGEPRKSYLGRALLPADPPERPSLLPLPRAVLPGLPRPRCLEGPLVHRSRHRPDLLRARGGHAGAGRQRRPAEQLHLRLPFAPPSDRRVQGPALGLADPAQGATNASAASTGAT